MGLLNLWILKTDYNNIKSRHNFTVNKYIVNTHTLFLPFPYLAL